MQRKSRIFTIIVGDLVHSRNRFGRQKISNKIRLALNHLFKEFQKEFYAPLALTRGIDELSGVLKRPNMSYRICTRLNASVYPYTFRFAIVNGHLDIAVGSKDARKMDGPAFHAAADIIQSAKKENRHYFFKLKFQFAEVDSCLNELANLVYILRGNRSQHQRRVARLYEKYENQKKVAKKLNITQQAVSDALRQAHSKELIQAENKINEILNAGNIQYNK